MQTYLPAQKSASGCVRCCAPTAALAPDPTAAAPATTTTQRLLQHQHQQLQLQQQQQQNINNRDNADIYRQPASQISQYGKLGIYIV